VGAARVICSNYKFKVVAIVVMYCWLEYQVIVIAFKNKGLLHCNIILLTCGNTTVEERHQQHSYVLPW